MKKSGRAKIFPITERITRSHVLTLVVDVLRVPRRLKPITCKCFTLFAAKLCGEKQAKKCNLGGFTVITENFWLKILNFTV